MGDELLVGYDNKESLDWPLGLVVSLFLGNESEDSPRGTDQTPAPGLSIRDKPERCLDPYP